MTKIGREYIDDLTGLYNRRYLLTVISKKLEEGQRVGIPLSIVLIDLDHFKDVNDTYGHRRGDVVLREFGMFLKALLRQDDTVFRYGGDEFICILPNANYEQAVMISQRFIEKCRIKEFAQNRLTLSIGIASSPESARDWRTLFDIADRNLYSAKRHGRDRVGVFEKERKGLNIPIGEIIGRDEEIVRVKEFIKPIFSGSSGAVCISGEVGVGKTRLVQEVIRDSDFQDMQFLNSNLSATTQSIPYYPFREIIRCVIKEQGLESIKDISQAYQIELSKIVPELSDKSKIDEHIFIVDKFRLFEGVRRFLALQASKAPLFVCLDNIHWADHSSLELFHYLVRTLKNNPVFFFLVYRIEEVKDSSFQNVLQLMAREALYKRIDLEPLQTADVARMLSLMIDAIPSSELTEYIFKETGGNPFFIEELMKSLEVNGAFIWDKGKWVFDRSKKIVIPYSVEGVVERKLGMIDIDAHSLLEYAAVIGREFDFTFLRDITKMNEGHLFDLMDEILGMRLLRESGGERYCFSEDVIRGIIYGQINKVKLRRYHRAVGEMLLSFYEGRTEEIVEELSNHFYLSGDKEKTIEYSMISADRAKDAYANRDAIRFYTWAIECLKGRAIRGRELKEIECLKNRAGVLNLIGENEKAKRDLEDAINKVKGIGNKKGKADCLVELCKVYGDSGQYKDALVKADLALDVYKKVNNPKGEAITLKTIGNIHWNLGKYSKALEFYKSSLKITEDIGDLECESKNLNNIGVVYDVLGEHSKASGFYNRSLKIVKEIGNRRDEATSLNNIGLVYDNLGEYSKALEFCKGSLKITEEIGDRKSEARSLNNIGITHWYLGEYSNALEFFQGSLKIEKEIGNRRDEAAILSNIGVINKNLGKYSNSLEYYRNALKIQEDISDRKGKAQSLNNIGMVHSNIGEYSKALKFYKDSLKIRKEIGDHKGEVESLISIGEIFIESRNFSNAEKYCNKACSIAKEIKSKPLLVDVSLDIVSLNLERNKLKETKRELNKILSFANELRSKEIKAKALCLFGRHYTKEGKWDKADASFKESKSIFKEMQNKFELAKVYYYLGLMYKNKGEETNAEKYQKKAIKIFKKLGAKGWIKKI